MPPELQQSYSYAQRNVRLVRWVVTFIAAFGGLVAISTAGLVYMHQATAASDTDVAQVQAQLKAEKLDATKAQAEDITKSLRLAVQVLGKEILFSKLLAQLATVTPSNAILTDLTISKTQGAVDITALTTDYNAATQLQVNLADPANKIFTHADVVSITCNTTATDPTSTHYPCTVIIRALFATKNPFLFINSPGAT